MIFQLGVFEGVPECFVAVFATWVEVAAECALDDGGVLRNDGEVGAKIVEAEAGGVDFVDGDVAGGGLDEAESAGVLVQWNVRADASWILTAPE